MAALAFLIFAANLYSVHNVSSESIKHTFLKLCCHPFWKEGILRHSALRQNSNSLTYSIHCTKKSSFSTTKIVGSPIFCTYFPFSMQIQSCPENLVLITLEIFFHYLPARQFLKLACQ